MFKGFIIESLNLESYYYDIGDNLYIEKRNEIKKKLSFLEGKDCILDATKIQIDWFPEINVDVFISHSHLDEKLAKTFAGWLYDKFELTSFIDSCLWGYCDELLFNIDKNFCTINNRTCFDYEKRNKSTSIVHIILSNALARMIDQTECLFFLDTLSSVPLKDIKKGEMTYSPWIYNELEISRMIRSNYPRRENNNHLFSLNEDKEPQAAFSLMTDHLIYLSQQDLYEWSREPRTILDYYNGDIHKGTSALDQLYIQKNLINYVR